MELRSSIHRGLKDNSLMVISQIKNIVTSEVAAKTIAVLQTNIKNELKKPLCSIDCCLIDSYVDSILYLNNKFNI